MTKISIQFKSFHRPPLYRPNTVRTEISYRDTRAKMQNVRFFLFSQDAPRFKSTVQYGILRGNLYDVDCRCSRCSRPLFPLSIDFFSDRSIGPSVSSHLYPPLCVVVAKWLWIPLVYDRMKLVHLSRKSRLSIRFGRKSDQICQKR